MAVELPSVESYSLMAGVITRGGFMAKLTEGVQ